MISIDTFKRGLKKGFDVLILLGKIMRLCQNYS